MITILGIIIFAIPFIFVNLFKDKTVGTLFIFTTSFLVHMLVALGTQSLKIFNYPTIISIYLTIDVALLLAYYFKYRHFKSVSNSSSKSLSENVSKPLPRPSTSLFLKILLAIAFVIVFFNLLSVHYNFSGVVNTYGGEVFVEKSLYEYPYFSDEWVAIAFVNYSISTQSLPIVNPLSGVGEFKNPLVPYFSHLANLFLFFGLSPLNDFTLVALIVGMMVMVLFYILLSSLGIDKRISVITLLTIPYITNGGNLPGIWFLIPMIFSLMFYLILLISLVKKNDKLAFISSFMCLCFYPPFIAFVFPTLLPLLFRKDGQRPKVLSRAVVLPLAVLFTSFILIASIVFVNNINPKYVVDVLKYYLFRTNLVGGILYFPIWIVLPFFTLPFALLGLWPIFKQKLYFIIFPLFVGLTYWLVYVVTEKVFIIDLPRVVVITSFLILVVFAISLNYLLNKLSGIRESEAEGEKKRNATTETENAKIMSLLFTTLAIASIVIATEASFKYTENDSWTKLTMQLNENPKGSVSYSAPTASRFLTEDDLLLFKDIKAKNFISPPWKGLVISAATGNHPLATKPSTIDVFTLNYYDFLSLPECKEKEKVANENKIDYVYSTNFECPHFILQGTSSEGLILYKYENSL